MTNFLLIVLILAIAGVGVFLYRQQVAVQQAQEKQFGQGAGQLLSTVLSAYLGGAGGAVAGTVKK